MLSLTIYAEETVPAEVSVADTVNVSLQTDSTTNTTIFDVMSNVVVHQDSAIYRLVLDKVLGRETQEVEITGYRVQIYSSNNQQTAKQEAIKLEKDMQNKLDLPLYVSYMPPFWKVRIGDFETYEEAQEFKNSFVQEFPELMGDTYVVRDQVILRR